MINDYKGSMIEELTIYVKENQEFYINNKENIVIVFQKYSIALCYI